MTSLQDVCFEQIQDQYWYGLYGDFKIIFDKNTGYFNATKLCQDGGRRFDNWLRNKRSKELMRYFALESDSSNNSAMFRDPSYTVKGNKNPMYNTIFLEGM
jgi:KilA-N domain.